MRTSTDWHSTLLDGKQILWIIGNEGTGMRVCSVHDPERDAAARRLVRDSDDWTKSHEEPLNGEPRGLTVYGRYKWDRPTLDLFPTAAPEYAYLLDGILEGRGVTDGGLSPAAALGRKGGAAGTGDSKRRGTDHYREMAKRSAAKRRKP